VTAVQRRVGVFVDYWWLYSSARQVFPGPEAPPPPWFGNVAPAPLAHALVKHPPAGVRRSQRVLGGLRIFIRHYDPEVHRSQHERVLRWRADGAAVDVGPSRGEGGGFWQSSVSVALACEVVAALARGDCDTAVVFAGDAALLPLFSRFAGDPARIELATWVAPDGSTSTLLPGLPGVWVHRLGEASFRQVTDDRRLPRPGATAHRPHAAPPARRPGTAMAAAFVAAGLGAGSASPPDVTARGPHHAAPEPGARPPRPQPDVDELDDSRVRRLTHRLFGREA
jgi:hypothetical protein